MSTPHSTPHSLGATPEAHLRAFVESADPEAAGRLFDATAPALFRLALTLAHDAAAAEDALQETFLAALEHAARFDDGRPVLPWLSGILRRKIGRQRRDAARTPDAARLAAATPADGPLALAASAEERKRVHAAIDALPEPYRGVALLRWRYGLGPAEIAHARGEPPGTVRSLLHRAARKLEAGLGTLPAVMVVAGGRGLHAMRARVVETAAHLRPAPRTAETVADTLTAEDGTFSLRLRRGDLVDVRVEAVGYVQAGERLAIELLPETGGGVALTVLVLDVDDVPVENASVRVFTLASQPDVSVDLRETTDATGRATFGSLPPSTRLQADVDAAGLGNPSWVPFELPAAGAHEQTIRLPRGRTIAGTVTDAATGLPIANALIGMNWVQNKAVRSGTGGAYELTGWSGKGTREITVTAEGYGRRDDRRQRREHPRGPVDRGRRARRRRRRHPASGGDVERRERGPRPAARAAGAAAVPLRGVGAAQDGRPRPLPLPPRARRQGARARSWR